MSKEFSISQACLEAVCAPENSIIMILGGSDTGKTTLVEYLADLLAKRFKVGIVDCDMGQSHIGPPTTIAWGRVGDGFSSWENIEAEDFYFTGSLSPVGNLLPTICGTKIIYDKARKFGAKLLTSFNRGFTPLALRCHLLSGARLRPLTTPITV